MARSRSSGYVEEPLGGATTTRPSATANFYVDSLDKDTGGADGDFVITKNQSLFNGFFSRIAVAEVVLDWGIPNIAQHWGNNFLTVAVDNGGVNADLYTIVLPDGFYSALDALGRIASLLNAAPGQTNVFSVGTSGPSVELGATQPFTVVWEQSALVQTVPAGTAPNYDFQNALARAIFSPNQLLRQFAVVVVVPNASPFFSTTKIVQSPLILGTRYVDFVSIQLTANQNLKDTSSAEYPRDVIYRWYLAWDTNAGVESIGNPAIFPYFVLQGYKPFNQRRVLPYPKQIRWDVTQPIGQVGFQAFDDRGRLIDTTKYSPEANFQFQMSMLLSED